MNGTLSQLQGEAWHLCNLSFHVSYGEPYRMLSRELYLQDVHDRIAMVLDKLDAQNAYLDSLSGEQQSNAA